MELCPAEGQKTLTISSCYGFYHPFFPSIKLIKEFFRSKKSELLLFINMKVKKSSKASSEKPKDNKIKTDLDSLFKTKKGVKKVSVVEKE
jgi:hypothetical protein